MAKERFHTEVTGLLAAHPLRKEIDALRKIILGTDKRIEEGVKWNTASFRTTEWFATLNGPKQVKEAMIILHAGAKAKGIEVKAQVADPTGMIKWLGADRGMITFTSLADIQAKHADLQALIRAWLQHI